MDVQQAIGTTGELLFEFANSVVLIPRTLFKIVRNPAWSVEYLTSQSSEKAKNRFEKYSHPILFWIVTGILPYYFLINTYFQGFTEGKILEAYNGIGAANIIVGLSIFLVSFPLSCSFILQLFKYRGFTKTTFKRSFFIQLYITAPVQLFYLPLLLPEEIGDDLLIPLYLLGIAFIFWFLVAELLVIRKETNYNWLISLCLLSLMYFMFFVFAGICTLIFFLINIGHFQKMINAWMGDIDLTPQK